MAHESKVCLVSFKMVNLIMHKMIAHAKTKCEHDAVGPSCAQCST